MEAVVCIEGDGIAACCCARLLASAGAKVAVSKGVRRAIPAILLSQATQRLLSDIFHTENLFEGAHRIRKRIVAWGPGAPVKVLEHSALVLPEQVLLERMWQRTGNVAAAATSASWTVFSSAKTSSAAHRSFGSRMATFSRVRLLPDAEPDACWIESVGKGWLFLVATGDQNGAILSVGAKDDELLSESRLVRKQIESRVAGETAFPAYPRIAAELCGESWLSCGTAAMNFDPLCGEGAGNAVREAILAAAAIKADAGGADSSSLLAEYSTRLTAGFVRHLHLCREFYSRGPAGPFWDSAVEPLGEGIAWLEQRLDIAPACRYRLRGFDLEPAASSVSG